VVGQRQLQQDAVDALVGVEPREQLAQLVRLHVAGHLVVEGLDAHLGAVLALHAHVDRGRRIVADEHRRQARLHG
jgi:hypothetical protein